MIDFTENGKSNQGNPIFEANPGGAPCNVLAMLAKLGHNTAFIGKVGNDFFGDQLRVAIKEAGNVKFCQCSSFYHYYKKRCAASNA